MESAACRAAGAERGLFSKFFSTGALVLLGAISFSIYLLHQIFLRWIGAHAGLSQRLDAVGFPLFALFLLAVLAAAWLSWKYIERPGRQLLLRLVPAPPTA